MRREKEYRFCEDRITDETDVVDLKLPVSSLLEVLRLGRSYDLSVVGTVFPNSELHKPWSFRIAQGSSG